MDENLANKVIAAMRRFVARMGILDKPYSQSEEYMVANKLVEVVMWPGGHGVITEAGRRFIREWEIVDKD